MARKYRGKGKKDDLPVKARTNDGASHSPFSDSGRNKQEDDSPPWDEDDQPKPKKGSKKNRLDSEEVDFVDYTLESAMGVLSQAVTSEDMDKDPVAHAAKVYKAILSSLLTMVSTATAQYKKRRSVSDMYALSSLLNQIKDLQSLVSITASSKAAVEHITNAIVGPAMVRIVQHMLHDSIHIKAAIDSTTALKPVDKIRLKEAVDKTLISHGEYMTMQNAAIANDIRAYLDSVSGNNTGGSPQNASGTPLSKDTGKKSKGKTNKKAKKTSRKSVSETDGFMEGEAI